MSGPRGLPDRKARVSALTELDRSLLVEAGAGSGKTAIMAGRVAMLLARGTEPKGIAAITFTEFAASELMIRISRFVGMLARGLVPRDLELAFPGGLTRDQQANLRRAQQSLDQLLCSTIHGFAQALIKPYPVEARIDPGAEIIDPPEADLAFDEHYDAWLRSHLTEEDENDVVAEIVMADESGALDLLRSVADFRRRNRDALPLSTDWPPNLFDAFAGAVEGFQNTLARGEFVEADTREAAEGFATILVALAAAQLRSAQPSHGALFEALFVPKPKKCFRGDGAPRKLQTKTKWEAAAAAAGRRRMEGTAAYGAAIELYEGCHAAFDRLSAAVAGVDSRAALRRHGRPDGRLGRLQTRLGQARFRRPHLYCARSSRRTRERSARRSPDASHVSSSTSFRTPTRCKSRFSGAFAERPSTRPRTSPCVESFVPERSFSSATRSRRSIASEART